MWYIIPRGCWCHANVPNVHAPTVDIIVDVKFSFYEELEHIFNKITKLHKNILVGDFNAKGGKEDIFEPKIGVGIVNFKTSTNLIVKSTMFQHGSIHNYTLKAPDGKTHNCI
jgi:exonuclease III